MHRLIEDANAIIPESEIFKVQGSYAPFADWFRHKLVSVTGGFWVDTDVVCLRKFEFDEAMVFGLMETDYANIAVMRFPIGHIVTKTLAEACNNPNCILPYDDFRTRKRKLIRKYLLGNRRNTTSTTARRTRTAERRDRRPHRIATGRARRRTGRTTSTPIAAETSTAATATEIGSSAATTPGVRTGSRARASGSSWIAATRVANGATTGRAATRAPAAAAGRGADGGRA